MLEAWFCVLTLSTTIPLVPLPSFAVLDNPVGNELMLKDPMFGEEFKECSQRGDP